MNKNILSIDIGIHNLGYALWDTKTLSFGIINIDKYNNMNVVERCTKLYLEINNLFNKCQFQTVIIERQVNLNTLAMELMYALTSIMLYYTEDIIIFDPKLKFTKIRESYNTRNKEHKKKSIAYAKNILTHINHSNEIDEFEKQDDVSDAITQLIINSSEDIKYLRSMCLN
jgi:Holliday junction resolvasome RuvABC endonuclease subunit